MAKDLMRFVDMDNIAGELTDDELLVIGSKVVDEYEIDLASRAEWEKVSKEALRLACQLVEAKTFPYPNCANVIYPLITDAAIQFAARAYPDIVKGNDIVKARVTGYDPDNLKGERAERVSQHMSYQLLEEMGEWEEDTDKLLMVLPIVGTAFKKTYFDPVLGRNVSKYVSAEELVVNMKARSLDTVRRKTEHVWLYENEVIERQRAGLYLDKEVTYTVTDNDPQASHLFLEQHRYMDLDNDGYEEPYIVIVHKDSKQVMRITAGYDADGISYNGKGDVAHIAPVQYYTKYSFIPNPKGEFYDFGFGTILCPLNVSINTTINQLLDAGTWNNTQCGFISRNFRIKGGTLSLAPNEWKQIDAMGQDIKAGIVPLPKTPPSPVLFQLLGFLVEAGKGLASMAQVLQGEGQPNTPATTTLALIEQGLKVYSSVYKRIFRSLKSEYRKVYRLNSIYLEDQTYFIFQDMRKAVAREDYAMGDMDIVPVADPSATDIQRLIRAQALLSVPGLNPREQQRQYLAALKYTNEEIDRLLDMPEQEDPKMIEVQIKAEQENKRLAILEAEAVSRIEVNETVKVKNLADAEAKEMGPQIDAYMQQSQQIHEQTMQQIQGIQQMMQAQVARKGAEGGREDNGGGIPGMEEPSGNDGSDEGVGGVPASMAGEQDIEGYGGFDATGGGA